MELVITVCNVCQNRERQVRRYTISDEERSVTVDLCNEHDSPLRQLMDVNAGTEEVAPPAQPRVAKKAAAPRKRGGRQIVVTPPDQIKKRDT